MFLIIDKPRRMTEMTETVVYTIRKAHKLFHCKLRAFIEKIFLKYNFYKKTGFG